jgi:protein-L-isoaspartate(D-aspartate) O-methyltransferase
MSEVHTAQTLVETLKKRGELHDSRVEQAFLKVPRAAFLPAESRAHAYHDAPVIIRRDPDGTIVSTSSQPGMMALMIEQMRLTQGMNILEIGAGSGYNAAIIKHIVGRTGRVTSVEFDPVIASTAQDNLQRAAMGEITVVHADGAGGFAPRAAYDRIIATVGVYDLPRHWVRQLKPRGLIVAPLWLEGFQFSGAFQLQPDGSLYSERSVPCSFLRMRGPFAGPRVEMRVGPGGLMTILSSGVGNGQIDPAMLNAMSSDQSEGYIGMRLSPYDISTRLVPWLLLAVKPPYYMASFSIPDGQQVFGLTGHGFAILSRGSATFVPLGGGGTSVTLGAASADLALQDAIAAWERAGKPGVEQLRLRLTPLISAAPRPADGQAAAIVSPRIDHAVEAWME